MTNTLANIAESATSDSSTGFLAQYTGEIIVGVVTAALLGASALVWQLFIYPRIQAWQKRKAADAKRDEIISSLNGMTFTYGSRIDFKDRNYIGVTLQNTTSQPVVIRQVAFRHPGGGRLILFHNPDDKLDKQTTQKTRTGIEIPAQSEATWYYLSADMRGEPLIAKRCSVQFEYHTQAGEVFTHEIDSSQNKQEEIAWYFQWIWNAMTKTRDEKEGKIEQKQLAELQKETPA